MPTPTLAEQIAVITSTAFEDLSPLWVSLSPQEAAEALFDMLPAIVDTWATASGAFAADWYDDQREDNEIRGRFHAIVPDLGDLGAEQLAGWGAEPLRREIPDLRLTRSRIEGGLQRRITNVARDTVMTSAIEDPQSRGWQRVARSGGCSFCVMLAGRGAIYTSKSADFGAHDFCHCSATPAWSGKEIPVKPYRPSSREITDADRARVREWIKANP
jgi:hypothetical protein